MKCSQNVYSLSNFISKVHLMEVNSRPELKDDIIDKTVNRPMVFSIVFDLKLSLSYYVMEFYIQRFLFPLFLNFQLDEMIKIIGFHIPKSCEKHRRFLRKTLNLRDKTEDGNDRLLTFQSRQYTRKLNQVCLSTQIYSFTLCKTRKVISYQYLYFADFRMTRINTRHITSQNWKESCT